MKSISSFAASFFFLLTAFAQKHETPFTTSSFEKIEITLKPDKKQKRTSLPFKNVFVFDKRNDTTIIGFANLDNRFATVTLKNGTSDALEIFSKKIIDQSYKTDDELIMVIRKLWVSQEIENEIPYDQAHKPEKKLVPGIISRFEFYIKQGYYFTALCRYDTILKFTNKRDNIPENINLIITEAFKKVGETIISNNGNTNAKRNWAEIDSFSKQLQNLPILTTTIYNKGVYLSYKEFKDNNPSIKDYQIKKEPHGNVLYVKDENEQEYPARKVWGFSDGANIFIQTNNNYFQLTRKEYTFFTLSAKDFSTSLHINSGKLLLMTAVIFLLPTNSTVLIPGPLEKRKYLKLNPYLLDIETGVLY